MEDDNKQYEEVCSMCRRSESIAGKMIKMPGNTMVCRDCMQRMFDQLGNGFPFPDINLDFLNPFANPGAAPFVNMNKGREAGDSATENNEASGTGIDKSTFDEEKYEEKPGNNTGNKAENNTGNKTGQRNGAGPLGNLFNGLGIPQVFLNIGPGMEIPQRQKVKKKKTAEAPIPELKIDELPPPHVIKSCLDDYVIGQEHAKKVISVAVYNHYKRVTDTSEDGIEIEKSNMLMIGPTGCGKTYLVKTLARILNVPLAITDATTLTEAGYIGDDVESVLSKLLMAADNDVEKAEHGIVFIDEIDKIAKKRNTTSRDVSGESVQQGLLKLLEGADVEVPVGATSKNAMAPLTTINTSNILFICGGAFPDLEEIVKARLNKHSSMGFDADLRDKYDNDPNLLAKVTTEDLREYGMIPEFLGRLPVIYALQGLTKESYKKILTEPKNAILKQYKKLLARDEVELVFDDTALDAIAEEAMERKTGARALRAIIEEFMLDIMYEIPKDSNIGRVTITGDYIKKKGSPIIDMREH